MDHLLEVLQTGRSMHEPALLSSITQPDILHFALALMWFRKPAVFTVIQPSLR